MALSNKIGEIYSDIYFLYTVKSKTVEIQLNNIIPDTLSYSYSPQFSAQATLGRMSPIQIYSGGSDKIYSFTLILHEDMLESNSNFSNLTDLVDAIKSLSYPTINTQGIIVKPQVEFFIGKISGKGIVKTSINWKKPFRNGKYIQVEITFNIIAETINNIPEVRLDTVKEVVDGILVYNERVVISSSEAVLLDNSLFDSFNYYENNSRLLGGLDIDTPLSDFVMEGNSAKPQQVSNAVFTGDYFDMARDLIRNIIGEKSYGEPEELVALRKSLSTLDAAHEDLFSFVSSDFNNKLAPTSNLKENLALLEESFTSYLDYYYENIDKNMTREEYNKVLGEISIIIDNMEDMYEAVSKYGEIS